MKMLELHSHTDKAYLDVVNSQNYTEAVYRLKLSLEIAYCDLLDVLAMDVEDNLAKLRQDYLEETIAVLGNQSRVMLDLTGKLNDEISKTRADPSTRTSAYHKLYEEHFDSLLSHNKYLKGDALDQITRLHKRNKNKQFRTTLALIFGAIGTIFGLVSFLIN